jgi:hypothetical protein
MYTTQSKITQNLDPSIASPTLTTILVLIQNSDGTAPFP